MIWLIAAKCNYDDDVIVRTVRRNGYRRYDWIPLHIHLLLLFFDNQILFHSHHTSISIRDRLSQQVQSHAPD